jgi:hypothetical protein
VLKLVSEFNEIPKTSAESIKPPNHQGVILPQGFPASRVLGGLNFLLASTIDNGTLGRPRPALLAIF